MAGNALFNEVQRAVNKYKVQTFCSRRQEDREVGVFEMVRVFFACVVEDMKVKVKKKKKFCKNCRLINFKGIGIK